MPSSARSSRRRGRWAAIPRVSFPRAGDAQLFYWEQRALGEIVTVEGPDGQPGCLGYAAFIERRGGDGFAPHLAPLRTLLKDLKPDTPRWRRLMAFAREVRRVDEACRDLLALKRRTSRLPPLDPAVAGTPPPGAPPAGPSAEEKGA